MTYHWQQMSERERNALVAEKVMGWTVIARHGIHEGTFTVVGPVGETQDDENGYVRYSNTEDGARSLYRRYTTDIAAAWRVVERMRSNGWGFIITTREPLDNKVGASFLKNVDLLSPHGAAASESAPEAICQAALRAVGVEVEP